MKILIISDIHDNIKVLERFLDNVPPCEVLLELGDLCSAFTMAMLRDKFPGPIHSVWGNNAGDKVAITKQAEQREDIHLHGDMATIELGGRKIALTHYPHIADVLAAGQQFDLVCHGHDHHSKMRWAGRTLVLDPGEVLGRYDGSSYAIYDTETGRAEILDLT